MELNLLFQAFFEESSDALLAVDLQKSLIVRANKTLCSLYGFNQEDVEGERFNILHTSLPEGHERERTLTMPIMEHEGLYNDILIVTQNNETRYASVRVRHIHAGDTSYAIAVLSDDTERQLMMRDLVAKHQSMEQAYVELESVHLKLKNAQEKMAQASKLVALGELAAGMSHELNQPLTGVRGFAQELQDIIQSSQKIKKKSLLSLTGDIIYNADKMASLLSHLRNFARQEKKHFEDSKLEEVSLKESIDSVHSLLAKQLKEAKIDFSFDVDEQAETVLAQRHQLEQVLINLVTNSRDAIQESRTHHPRRAGRIELRAWNEGEKTYLRVSDNGEGIPQSLRDRIFDPFFSTKEEGKGMGLGLSISFSIVHNFGGDIVIEKSDPNGTSFLINLSPAASSQKKEAA